MNDINQGEIFEGMFNDATEGIIVSNEKGRIILANPKATQMFDYDIVSMLRLSIEDLVPGRYTAQHKEHRSDYFKKPAPRPMGVGRDLWAKRRDGSEFPIEISLSYVNSHSGMLVVSFIIDITERKRKDDELYKANELLRKTGYELARLNQELEKKVQDRTLELAEMIRKLTESKRETDLALQKERELNNLKSRFISTASHEFRTPLATIMSSVSLTGKYAESMDKTNMLKHISRVKSSVNHLTDILNDFLSLDKLEEGAIMANPEQVSLNTLIGDITEEIKPIAKAGQRISFTGIRSNDNLFIDKRILRNIMTNLISNAIKYSNENTQIDIRASLGKDSLVLQIKDQGIGIPIEDQPHIFERFYRANNIGNMQGTGLGLNIVRKYVELLGGTIQFKSIPDRGTTFTLEIPVKQINQDG